MNRSLKELYIIVYKKACNNSENKGICLDIYVLYIEGIITEKEHDMLVTDIKSQKPTETKNVDFYNHAMYRKTSAIDCYWWPRGHKLERLKFIRHLIDFHRGQK